MDKVERMILHYDTNNFYASVKCMLNPKSKGTLSQSVEMLKTAINSISTRHQINVVRTHWGQVDKLAHLIHLIQAMVTTFIIIPLHSSDSSEFPSV